MLKEIMMLRLYENSKLGSRKHATDAGIDLYFHSTSHNLKIEIPANGMNIIGTGLAVEIPEGYVGQIWPKSRSNFLIGGGVIDSLFLGELLVKVINPTNQSIVINHGDAIAQLLILPVETPTIREVESEEFYSIKSERGKTGGIMSQVSTATWLKDDELPEPSEPDINEGLHW
jgi:dUTP pyrophosphatase